MGLFRGHTTVTRANKISSFSVSTAEYGAAVPEIFGTTRLSGNVIYYDDFTAHEHRESHKAGKGGKSKTVSITYTYTVAVIIGLCEGPITGIGKVWRDKSVYGYPSDDIQLSLFKGTDSQDAWAYTKGRHPDKALPYKGLAYMAGVIDLGDSGSMPNYNFEVKGKLVSTGDGLDANPADVIRYVLDKVGLSKVEIEGLDNYRRYCAENDLLISSPSDSTDAAEAREIINKIISLTNAYMFWSNDHYKIVVTDDQPHGSWAPDTTIKYDLTKDDFIQQSDGALVTYSRKDSSDVYNQYPVEFINRENGYEKETVSYALTDDINEYGVRQASTTKAHWFYTKERAVKAAEALARQAQYGRNQYTFALDWAFCRLEVGDLVTLTDENIGLDKQVVRITAITEDSTGCLTVTAVSVPPLDASPAQYDVHNVDRPYIDYNAEAPDTDTPLIIQPPAELTSNGLEVWIGAKGTGDLWGGCDVYVSDDNTNYRSAGQITNTARIGALAAECTASDTTLTVTSNGDFLSGTKQDAERGNTLCWVDGECFSYETATLLSDGNWQLSGCVRGQYNTSATAHKAGAKFARLDNALLKIDFRPEDIGKTVWLKFASFNIFGSGNQDLSRVKAYEYNIQKYYIPPVTNLLLYNRYREQSDGVSRYDIVVKWDKPDWPSYLEGQVWFKTSGDMAENLSVKDGVPAEEMGFSGPWQYAGSGENCVIIPQAVVGDTYKVCVATKDIWGMTSSRDLAPSKSLLVAMKTTIPNVPDGVNITFGKAAVLAWKEVTNADVACYEVRTDKNPGAETPGLLVRTSSLSAVVGLSNRKGKIYLYARSAQGKYSEPAILSYNKPLPKKPKAPAVVPKLGGMAITTEAIPSDCIGVNIYIDAGSAGESKSIHSENNLISYLCDAGIYSVSAAFVDIFGEGPRSDATTCTVKVEIDQSMIKDEAISLSKVDNNLKQVFNTTIPDMEKGIAQNSDSITALVNDGKGYASAIAQNSTSITAVVTNLNSKDGYKNYTALSQLGDAINLRVAKNDVINQINLTSETTTIDGKHLHVTGNTVFDKNVIVSGMIQAGAVTADKLSVDSLSAITATIGTLRTATSGARIEISDNLIKVYDANNVLRVRMGVWSE